jgi:hypothetical protein
MQDIWVSLHFTWSRFTVSSVTVSDIATLAATSSTRLSKILLGILEILDLLDLRPLRGRHAYQGLLEVGRAKLLAAMLGDLGVSTLRLIKSMP